MATIALGVAVSIGASLLSRSLAPSQELKTGKLSDLSIPKSNYGVLTLPEIEFRGFSISQTQLPLMGVLRLRRENFPGDYL